jgi:hypothetical protein
LAWIAARATAFRGEGIVLEDFFAEFIPEVFLRIEFRGIGRKIQERDVVRNGKVAAATLLIFGMDPS